MRAVRDLWPWLAMTAAVGLLVLLGMLQFRWLGQVAEADRERTESALETAAERLAEDFNDELSSLFVGLQPSKRLGESAPEELRPALLDAVSTWSEGATWPDLLGALYLLVPNAPPAERPLAERPLAERPLAERPGPFAWRALRLEREGEEARFAPSVEPVASVERVLSWLERGRPDGSPGTAASSTGPSGPATTTVLEAGEPSMALDLLMADIPALVIPVPGSSGPQNMIEMLRGRRRPSPERRFPSRRFSQPGTETGAGAGDGRLRGDFWSGRPMPLAIVELDPRVIFETILPELVERHFGAAPEVRSSVYALEPMGLQPFRARRAASERDRSERDRPWQDRRRQVRPVDTGDRHPELSPPSLGKLLFETGPPAPGAEIEVSVPLFGPLRVGDRRGGRLRRGGGAPRVRVDLDRGRWQLVVRHPAGSLDAAVARTQRRNMAVVSGILGVLALALGFLANGYRQSRRLARQQLDFVAGVTHELMTPVAALRAAGQNLADGVVRDPAQVERYGKMIDSEGRRLAEQVDQVLAFARMQSSQPRLDLRPVDVAELLAQLAQELRPVLEAHDVRLEIEPADSSALQLLPAVRADASALRRSLTNLVTNAIKYGQVGSGDRRPGIGSAPPESSPDPSGWVGLTAHRRGDRVRFSVRDRGPGIAPRDRPHLFEPFYRGRGLAASAVSGSGLGLALVRHWIEAQGGKVGVETGAGATFWLELPTAADVGEDR